MLGFFLTTRFPTSSCKCEYGSHFLCFLGTTRDLFNQILERANLLMRFLLFPTVSAAQTATDVEATGLGDLGNTREAERTIPTAAGPKQGEEQRVRWRQKRWPSGFVSFCMASSATGSATATTATAPASEKWVWHESCISWASWW